MSLSDRRKSQWLTKKQKQGFRGYPAATLAYYGPTDKLATKLAIGYVFDKNEESEIVDRIYSSDNSTDVRTDETHQRVAMLLKELQVKSVVITDGIIGCPHEEGKEYKEGETCPYCPFWQDRDRWTGELVQ